MSIDLSLLPAPEILKTVEYETLLSTTKTRLVAKYDERDVDYDVDNLLTDPGIILAETKADDEAQLYSLANDVAKSNLLFFATGANLEHLVAPDVERMDGETDDRLKKRYILTRLGRAEERYKAAAMKVHVNVEDVNVYPIKNGPRLEVAILSADNDGVATQTLLDDVASAISTESGRSINDVIGVVSAVKHQVSLTAKIWLTHDADSSVTDLLEQHVKDAWNLLAVMGLDLVPSWVIRELHRVGVQRVELVDFSAPVIAKDNEAIAINSVDIQYEGRDR